jgi:hypothetical protein
MKLQAKKTGTEVVLFVTRSGPRKGDPECQAAFETKDEAVRFLTDLHGLSVEEGRVLRKDLRLKLRKKVHGSELCSITAEPMTKQQAQLALSGDPYIDATAGPNLKPRKIA